MEIIYEASTSDHFPFVVVLDCGSLPEMSQEDNSDFKSLLTFTKLDWSMLTNEDVMLYLDRTDGNFNLIN